MPKKPKIDFAVMLSDAAQLSESVSSLCADVDGLEAGGDTVDELRGLQRHLILIARDATSAAARLYPLLKSAAAMSKGDK